MLNECAYTKHECAYLLNDIEQYDDLIEYAETNTEQFEQVVRYARDYDESLHPKTSTYWLCYLFCVDEGVNYKKYKFSNVYLPEQEYSETETDKGIQDHLFLQENK